VLGLACQQQATNDQMAAAPETQPADATDENPSAESRTTPEPQRQARPRRDAEGAGLNKTVAIRNDPDAPIDDAALESVRTTFQSAGGTLVDSLEADLLVLCSGPPRQWSVGRAPEEMVYLVETRMPAGDVTLRLPPDWTPRVPDSRWQALVEFELVEWQTRGESTWAMPVVTINLARHGIDHPDFDRADLEQLQALAEDWARQRPWLSRRR
jgi:hypothetical protein